MYFTNHPIVTDFNRFVDYICDTEKIELTKTTANLRAVELLALNERMQQPLLDTKNKPTHKDFVLLTTFFYIGLAADLWRKKRNVKGAYFLTAESSRIALYDQMTDDERYGFLLQAYWCYFDVESAFDDRGYYFMDNLLEGISQLEAGKTYTNLGSIGNYRRPKHLMVVLAAFGVLEYTVTPEKGPDTYIHLSSLTISETGKKILSVLGTENMMIQWRDLNPNMTSQLWEKLYGKPEGEIPELSDFFEKFKTVFPDWKVKKRLFPIGKPAVMGVFKLKIALSAKCYRVIEMHSSMSFVQLHLAIQDIFDFDNDHLYAFYLNGRAHHKPGNVIGDPRGGYMDGDYPADLILLGEVDLYAGQSLLYVFDFGDSWEFSVEIMDFSVSDDKIHGNYKLIQSVGDSPDQYNY
ncbi:MAG: plasmid pRiA4b ORF-3 family protein [Bacteroidetes bacterium]|nr:plasmid pRiA4b ORF-3 family protein [Bacteroidota bacterium]